MKKIIAFFLLFLPILFLLKNKEGSDSIFNLEGVDKACIVTKSEAHGQNFIETMACNYIYLDEKEIEKRNDIKDILGYILYLKNSNTDYITKKLQMLILNEENIEDKKVLYGYTPFYKDSVYIQNKKVNVEMILDQDEIIVGFPMILSGY